MSSGLARAITARQLQKVERLLAEGADPNSPHDGGTVLHEAVRGGHYPEVEATIVRRLVEHGADLEARDREGATPLIHAARNLASQSPIVRSPRGREWARGVLDERPADEDWGTFLGGIRARGDEVPWPPDDEPEGEIERRLAILSTLIELGADLDARDDGGMSAADVALFEKDLPVLVHLVEHGADTAGFDAVRLVEAATEGRRHDLEALLDRGGDPDARLTRRGTPLGCAAARGHLEVVEALLDHGADPDRSRSDAAKGDFTPLLEAVYGGHLAVARRLLERGADPFAPGPRGADLLTYAQLGRQDRRREGPWDEIVELVREAIASGPPRVHLAPLDDDLPILRALAAAFDQLAETAWRSVEIGPLTLLESGTLTGPPAEWEELRRVTNAEGWSLVVAGWSLDEVSPEVGRARRALESVAAEAGRRWLESAIADLREEAEEEGRLLAAGGDDPGEGSVPAILEGLERASVPVGMASEPPVLGWEGRHLALVAGAAPEAALVLYGLETEELEPATLASVLAWWRGSAGAELAAFDGARVDLVLPEAIADEAEIRRSALELFALCPDLEGPEAILGMSGGRHWSLWWD